MNISYVGGHQVDADGSIICRIKDTDTGRTYTIRVLLDTLNALRRRIPREIPSGPVSLHTPLGSDLSKDQNQEISRFFLDFNRSSILSVIRRRTESNQNAGAFDEIPILPQHLTEVDYSAEDPDPH